MSFEAIRWALSQSVQKSSAKFVLVAMADCVNAEGEADMLCWPSYRHLIERTGQDVKTVEAGLRRLRESGFIVDTGERKGGTGQVIVYRLNTPKSGAVTAFPKIDVQEPNPTASGGVNDKAKTPDFPENTPEFGAVDTGGKPPVFPAKTPVFPKKDPQISRQRPPKTGDGTSNGTSKGTRKEPVSVAHIDGIPESLLVDYLAVRKAKKAGPLTQTAIDGLKREAAKAGLSLSEAVTVCCEAGWQGFNAGWYANRTGSAGSRTPTKSTGRHTGFDQKNYYEGVAEDGHLA